jgi:hypothetical protein
MLPLDPATCRVETAAEPRSIRTENLIPVLPSTEEVLARIESMSRADQAGPDRNRRPLARAARLLLRLLPSRVREATLLLIDVQTWWTMFGLRTTRR